MAAALSALIASAPAFALYTVKYDFAGPAADGANSINDLIKVGNVYYGTTNFGGQYGYGTVFKLAPPYIADTILYSFQANANNTQDGANPRAGLTYVNGDLYGTTTRGGNGPGTNCPDYGSCSTVFELYPSTLCASGWCETVVYNFQGIDTVNNVYDGSTPGSDMIYENGAFYGTTVEGGSPACHTTYSSCGTVYSINLSSNPVETVLYQFNGPGLGDGANPYAAPVMVGGKLFGTTSYGGTACADLPDGCGTVYQLKYVNNSWNNETVLHRFGGAANDDGAAPDGKLVNLGSSMLYGTTFWGGANEQGMVFELRHANANNWPETNIRNFTGGTDGGHPMAGLTAIGKTLYGVTSSGGNSGCQFQYSYDGCGTIFKVLGTMFTPDLYEFVNSSSANPPEYDGGNPFGALIKSGQNLWGMTYGGGTLGNNVPAFGTIYEFTP